MNNTHVYNKASSSEPYIGMPICLDGCLNIDANNNDAGHACGSMSNCINTMPLAMAYVPMQAWNQIYDTEEGFYAGTIFPCLNLPFDGGMQR